MLIINELRRGVSFVTLTPMGLHPVSIALIGKGEAVAVWGAIECGCGVHRPDVRDGLKNRPTLGFLEHVAPVAHFDLGRSFAALESVVTLAQVFPKAQPDFF
jgi:hypothetical protein